MDDSMASVLGCSIDFVWQTAARSFPRSLVLETCSELDVHGANDSEVATFSYNIDFSSWQIAAHLYTQKLVKLFIKIVYQLVL